MRAAGIDRFGDPVRSITLSDPRPLAADEVLIEVSKRCRWRHRRADCCAGAELGGALQDPPVAFAQRAAPGQDDHLHVSGEYVMLSLHVWKPSRSARGS
jgi:hypothetical protein